MFVGLVVSVLVASSCGSDSERGTAVSPGFIQHRVAAEPDTTEATTTQASTDLTTGALAPTAEGSDPTASIERAPTAQAPVGPTPIPTTAPLAPEQPVAPNGRRAPHWADTPDALANQLIRSIEGLADPSTPPAELAELGHLHQVAIRKLGYEPSWDEPVMEQLGEAMADQVALHLRARRALMEIYRGYDAADFVPAWALIEPWPQADLLAAYQAGEQVTGIEWEYLAGINLIETGMGRIRGLSSAGAQGPMQFLPTTWAEPGIGEGDIDNPADAIAAAARYLVRRGGPADMDAALWGYNNSDDYVEAVKAYADLLRLDSGTLAQIYNWEIYFATEQGDIWLPVGYSSDESVPLADYLAASPWSMPPR